MAQYLVFLDINGVVQVFKILNEEKYLTHTIYSVLCVDCLPHEACSGFLEKVVRIILPFGWDRYIFMQYRIKRNEFIGISGGVYPYKGYLAFYPGYEYPVFLDLLGGKRSVESVYREMYMKMNSYINEILTKFKEDLEHNLKTIDDITNAFRDIYKKINDYMERSLGFVARGPESLLLAETGLMQITSPPPPTPPAPPTPPPPPPKPSLLQRIAGFFKRLFGRG